MRLCVYVCVGWWVRMDGRGVLVAKTNSSLLVWNSGTWSLVAQIQFEKNICIHFLNIILLYWRFLCVCQYYYCYYRFVVVVMYSNLIVILSSSCTETIRPMVAVSCVSVCAYVNVLQSYTHIIVSLFLFAHYYSILSSKTIYFLYLQEEKTSISFYFLQLNCSHYTLMITINTNSLLGVCVCVCVCVKEAYLSSGVGLIVWCSRNYVGGGGCVSYYHTTFLAIPPNILMIDLRMAGSIELWTILCHETSSKLGGAGL